MDNSLPVIPGFEILKLVGRGGMGAVYLARQQSLDRPVAVKILPAHLAENPSYLQRFKQEACAAAKVKHHGLVQVLDAGEYGGIFYYVMEFINGETTAQRLHRKGRLDQENALMIAESVAVALEHAWAEARLVHRDIKPDNILIDSDGTVKVADLGLAKLLDQEAASITISQALIGTPHYCSPEQARGDSDVDCRTDIYGLGATLYHFVVGRPPFADTSGIAAMVRALTDYLPDPVDCHPDIPMPVAWLIEKMMARDRNDRQNNWHETLDDIEQVMQGRLPCSQPLPPRASTVKRSARRVWPETTKRKPPTASRVAPVYQPSPPMETEPMPVVSPPPPAEPELEEESEMAPPDAAEIDIPPAAAAPGPAAAAGPAAETEPETETATSSRSFRVFLVIAAIFTVFLYVSWFLLERKNAAESKAPPAVTKPEPTVTPPPPTPPPTPPPPPRRFFWRKHIRQRRP
jgi:serine/threonine protein kinase